MRAIFLSIYILILMVVQTTVFPRLSLHGIMPDLALVSVIIFAILSSGREMVVFSAVSGFLQDILSFGPYLNTIVKILVGFASDLAKENFAGNDRMLAFLLVAIFSPAALVFEALALRLFFGRPLILEPLWLNVIVKTFYNLLCVPALFPLLKRISHAR